MTYCLIMCDRNKVIKTYNKTKYLVVHSMPGTEISNKDNKIIKQNTSNNRRRRTVRRERREERGEEGELTIRHSPFPQGAPGQTG